MKYSSTHSLYIHWPFCPYKCHFCPFIAIASQDQHKGQYHRSLCAELKQYREDIAQQLLLQTIFFGGGTPSTYPNHLLTELFDVLHEVATIASGCEITIEANPGTVSTEQLAVWRSLGINRLSIGVQSLNEAVLWSLNRRQKTADVLQLVENAHMYIEKISVDLILGLPGVTQNEWMQLLETVVTWPIHHVSIYFLTVHQQTPLYFKVSQGMVVIPQDEEMVLLYHWSCNLLEQHGFIQYEISNFARAGSVSRHNMAYWQRDQYRGIGIGACSYEAGYRWQNEKNIMQYMKKISEKDDVAIYRELLTSDQITAEKIMLGLRMASGISWSTLGCLFDKDSQHRIKKKIARLQQQGLVCNDTERIRLTRAGFAVQNEIVTQLLI